ncbi:conserved hypothetical protein [Rhodobacteraceae bacterium HTCC2083]|jgi:hypothetical protein|nr:conserved hypothetical protein [Rhodobacteraceae bacterium HTCC2083]
MTLLLAGCDSTHVDAARTELDEVYVALSNGPTPDPGTAFGPTELLESAYLRGPDFLQIKLDRTKARLDLDARKSQRNPRFLSTLRQQSTLNRDRAVVSGLEASIALDWDLATALIYTDKETLQIAEDYLPVQAELARLEATGKLLQAYFRHEEAIISNDQVTMRRTAAQCKRDEAKVEFELGNISKLAFNELAQVSASLVQQSKFAKRNIASSRRDLLYLAGVADSAKIRSGRDPSASLPALPKPLTRNLCYTRSGNALRDGLLLKGAQGALRVARLQRFGSFDIQLPTAISPGTGLNLNTLVSVLIPIVDQNDGQRRVQRAREALLAIALASERNQRSFDVRLSQLEFAQAQAATRLSEARSAASKVKDTASQTCQAKAETSETQLALRRARLELQKVQSGLALLCAQTDANLTRALDPALALQTAAPDFKQGLFK